MKGKEAKDIQTKGRLFKVLKTMNAKKKLLPKKGRSFCVR